MFTGIVQEVGTVEAVDSRDDSARMTISAREVMWDIGKGASIAVNGVCLTVCEFSPDRFTVDVMSETLQRTNLGKAAAGSGVNLERAMRADGRLDGHIVQGHVDGTARVTHVDRREQWTEFVVEVPGSLARYIVEKGTITMDGVALTVVSVRPAPSDPDHTWQVTVCLIPTTLELTTLSARRPGDTVNVEVDILAKYAERMITGGTEAQGGSQ